MKPIEFPEQNMVYAEGQLEYLPLPSYRDPDGTVTSCWKVTWKDRFRVLFRGRIWLTVLTFNHPLQPIIMEARSPLGAPIP